MDIREMLGRLRQGESNRAVVEAMQIDRKTVGRYRTWAAEKLAKDVCVAAACRALGVPRNSSRLIK